MKTIQEYLDSKYPTPESKIGVEFIKVVAIEESKELKGGELKIDDFPNLKGIEVDGWYLKTKLTKLEVNNCPNLTALWCSDNQLTSLVISNCPELKSLVCSHNLLEEIEIDNYSQIRELSCTNNQLKSLESLDNFLNPEYVTVISLSKNKFSSQTPPNLSFFSNFTNLESLSISNNPFTGSLEPLKNCKNLKQLFIDDTDIDSGLEYLPSSIVAFSCKVDEEIRPESKIKVIKLELEKYGEPESRGNESYNWTFLLQVWKKTIL